jgi:hypothetical protein
MAREFYPSAFKGERPGYTYRASGARGAGYYTSDIDRNFGPEYAAKVAAYKKKRETAARRNAAEPLVPEQIVGTSALGLDAVRVLPIRASILPVPLASIEHGEGRRAPARGQLAAVRALQPAGGVRAGGGGPRLPAAHRH